MPVLFFKRLRFGFTVLLALGALSACQSGTLISPSPAAQPEIVWPSSSTPIKTEIISAQLDRRQVDAAIVQQAIVAYTNQARAQEGLPLLAGDDRLAEVARAHSANMADNRFFDHLNPQGQNHQQRLDARYPGLVRGSGENIARYPVVVGSDQDFARRLVDGWLNSPGHRANILRPSFTRIGVGIAQTGNYVLATQVFAIQLSQAK